MNYKQHLIIGLFIAILFILVLYFVGWFNIYDWKVWITYGMIFYVYSLLADIDHKNSTITWLFIGVGIIGIIIAYYLTNNLLMIIAICILALTYLAAQIFKHRGITHTVWFAFLSAIPILILIGWKESLFAFSIYLSHLVADNV